MVPLVPSSSDRPICLSAGKKEKPVKGGQGVTLQTREERIGRRRH